MNQKIRKFYTAAAAFALLATGCSTQESLSSQEPSTEAASQSEQPAEKKPKTESSDIPATLLSAESPAYASDISAIFTQRDLRNSYDEPIAVISCEGSSVSVTGSGVSVSGSDVTITDEGVYKISGTLDDGQILVNSSGKVQLVLDNASLSCSDSAPIYVQQAKKCFLTLEDGTENFISDGETYTYAQEGDNEPDAAIFSTDSLTINGSGKLTVKGNFNEGITCKDDIVITGGTLDITAVGNGIKGKDYVAIADGTITVTAGGDGIKSTNTEDTALGFVYVQNGTVTVNAQEDGIQAETELIAAGGSFSITSGGGSANAQPRENHDFGGRGGFGNWGDYDETETTDESTVSTKGLKAGRLLYIGGGELTIDAADDAVHSNQDLHICGGSTTAKAGGDGVHADGLADFTGGSLHIPQSYEGVEAAGIRVSGDANLHVTASDDGFNASDGTSQGGMGTYSEACALEISGGTVYVNAGGDGLDSNGNLLVSGGTVTVDGPTNSGNGALDANGSIYCTGGVLIAAGSAGMAEYPRGSQNTVAVTLDSTQQGGTVMKICGSDGKEILSYTPAKQFNSLIVSTPDLIDGETYTIYAGDTEAGSFTVEDVITYIGGMDGMQGGFHGGFPGGDRGERPEGDWGERPGGGRGERPEGMQPPQGMEMPTDENGNPVIPQGVQPPQGMEMPTDENGNPVIPQGMQPPQGGMHGR
ncbi:MAG: carbohydrate-binding domain-containing protein [Oscillospiraceae bacterium]|nr:carbohydrate-binding domain-containing protein [Oscillospiraceae bacterium]